MKDIEYLNSLLLFILQVFFSCFPLYYGKFCVIGCILYHTGYHTDYLKLASFSDRKTVTKRSPAVNIYQITTPKGQQNTDCLFITKVKRSKENSACCSALLLKDVFFISLKSSHLES